MWPVLCHVPAAAGGCPQSAAAWPGLFHPLCVYFSQVLGRAEISRQVASVWKIPVLSWVSTGGARQKVQAKQQCVHCLPGQVGVWLFYEAKTEFYLASLDIWEREGGIPWFPFILGASPRTHPSIFSKQPAKLPLPPPPGPPVPPWGAVTGAFSRK